MTKFTTYGLALCEHHLGKPISGIIAEAQSEAGLSLRTLSALAAAKGLKQFIPGLTIDIYSLQFRQAVDGAMKDIDTRGAAVVGAEVGAALGEYIEEVMAEREAAV